ncbi:MAG TPA: hypothetical protein PK264_14695, partial [Hyphomicrobiaceae bacterium]|nr:hypothetical protein [Hyphomicrobiaceae bacterium]
MTKLIRWGMGASTALMAFTLALPGIAQTPPPAPTTPPPKVVPGPAVKPAPATAPKSGTPAPTATTAGAPKPTSAASKPAAAAPKTAPKPKTACNKMADEAACKADTTCQWIAAEMLKDKTGAIVKGPDGTFWAFATSVVG